MKLAIVLAVLCVIATVTQVECRGQRSGYNRRRHQNATTTQTRSSSCPSIECPDQHGICPYGPNQDEHGCTLCGCRPSRRCVDRPMCMMACPNGFENGPDGCPTCRCYTPQLTPVLLSTSSDTSATVGNRTTGACPTDVRMCRSACEYGREVDESGCETCACRQSPRPRGRDHHHHRNRQQQGQEPSVGLNARFKSANSTGAPATMSFSAGNQTSTGRTCPPMCLMFCEHGLKRDRNGCPLCECNSAASVRRYTAECNRPMCAMFCEHGFRTDSRGCAICQCFEPGTSSGVVASPQQCPRLRCHTNKRCAFGFEVDQETGCQGCICRQTSGA